MTLEQAVRRNPYDPSKGTIRSYVRYIRYTVEGCYDIPSSILYTAVEEAITKEEKSANGD